MNRTKSSNLRRLRQTGLSMIELLVGLILGAMVSVVAIASFTTTRTAATTIGDSSRLHQDAASAFHIIGHHLRQTGAQLLADAGGGTVAFNSVYAGLGTNLAPLSLSGVDGGNNGPDVLLISHDRDTSFNAVDCLAQDGQPDTGIINRFELVNGSLRCQGSGNGAAGPLIEGVEDFQVRYGVRTNDNLQYLNAQAGWNAANWNAVETVMVCLRLVGQVRGHAAEATTGCNGEIVANDGRIRRVFVRVFSIRNIAL